MKIHYIIFAVFLITATESKAQNDVSVEQSIFGIQTGILGVWVHNEVRLKDYIALRSEIGFDTGIFSSNKDYSGSNIGIVFVPSLTLEPRWYYNLSRRVRKSRNIANNSGNFIGLKINYHPDWFSLSNVETGTFADNIAIIPKWAIKRTIVKHFTYEAGLGIGYRTYFLKQYGFDSNPGEVALDLHIRIGYTF